MVNITQAQLAYVGIKLNNLDPIANNIYPRLAKKLIHEQQQLLILAVNNKAISFEDSLINFEPYSLNDVIYKGLIASMVTS